MYCVDMSALTGGQGLQSPGLYPPSLLVSLTENLIIPASFSKLTSAGPQFRMALEAIPEFL